MLLLFELSMPRIGSWNGKWSKENQRHLVFINLKKEATTKILGDRNNADFYHDFGDGWGALIKVKKSNSVEKKQLSSHIKNGFCNYNWMVDNIINHQSTYDQE